MREEEDGYCGVRQTALRIQHHVCSHTDLHLRKTCNCLTDAVIFLLTQLLSHLQETNQSYGSILFFSHETVQQSQS